MIIVLFDRNSRLLCFNTLQSFSLCCRVCQDVHKHENWKLLYWIILSTNKLKKQPNKKTPSNGNLGTKLQLFALLFEKASSCDYSFKELVFSVNLSYNFKGSSSSICRLQTEACSILLGWCTSQQRQFIPVKIMPLKFN